MTNLLHLVVSLVEDPAARQSFRDDPAAAVAGVDDLTGEDVVAAAAVARIQVDPAFEHVLTAAMDVRTEERSPHEAAIRALLTVCDSADAAAAD